MKLQLLNKLSLFCFCLFLFLLPFQVWNETVFPSQTGKILFAGWVSPVLLVFILIQSTFLKTESFKITTIDFGFIVYVIFYFVHLYLVKPVNLHPFSGIEILVMINVYLFVRFQSLNNMFWVLATLCLVAFVQAFYGILQYLSILQSQHQIFKITGTFFNPAPFAGYLAALLPVLLGGAFYFFNYKSAKYLSIFLFIIITVLGAIVLAKSRAAWLAVVVSTIYMFSLQDKSMNLSVYLNKFSYWNKVQNFKFRKPVVFVLTAFLMVAGTWKLYSLRPESANGRLLVWKSTTQMIADYPITGVGTGQFAAKYMHYQAQYLQSNNDKEEILLAENTIFAFNEFVRLTAEQGFPGLFFALLPLFFIFQPVQINDLNFIVAKSGLLSIFIFSLLSYPGSVLPVKVLFVIIMAIIASKQKQHLISISSININARKILMLFFVAVLTVSLIGYYLNLNGTNIACRDWKTASEEIESNRFGSGIEHCKSAYPFLKSDGFFMILYGNLLKKVGNYTDAETIFVKATHLLPLSDVYLSLGDCYLEQQKFILAENTYKYALQLVPARIKPVYSLAKLYMQTGKENEALCVIENYLESEFKKRTIASYEIELSMIELKKEIETTIK